MVFRVGRNVSSDDRHVYYLRAGFVANIQDVRPLPRQGRYVLVRPGRTSGDSRKVGPASSWFRPDRPVPPALFRYRDLVGSTGQVSLVVSERGGPSPQHKGRGRESTMALDKMHLETHTDRLIPKGRRRPRGLPDLVPKCR